MLTQVSNRGDMQDKLRSALLSYGEREISLTIDDLIGKTGLNYPQIYQALYRLQRLGELEILREQDESSGKTRVSGVRLSRMEPAETIHQRSSERETTRLVEKDFTTVSMQVPNVIDYMNRKLAIERARAEILKASLDPDEVIKFNPDPLGEEAIYLLSKLQETIEQSQMLTHDLAAEKRNVQYYKERIGSATFDDSGT